MTSRKVFRVARLRLILFIAVSALYITVILSAAVPMNPAVIIPAASGTGVMKLVDVQEEIPQAPPPPPPPLHEDEPLPNIAPIPEETPLQGGAPPGEGNSGGPPDAQELIAETMIETDQTPPPAVLGGAGDGSGVRTGTGTSGGVPGGTGTEQIVYLPQHMITRLPELPENRILRNIVYPPIARRSNIEGSVYLELFIDRQGNIRQIKILRENPAGRGFGEAAVNAFNGIKGKPAELNSEPVAVRYRYSINFTLK